MYGIQYPTKHTRGGPPKQIKAISKPFYSQIDAPGHLFKEGVYLQNWMLLRARYNYSSATVRTAFDK